MALHQGGKRELGVRSVTISAGCDKSFEQLPVGQPTQDTHAMKSANVRE